MLQQQINKINKALLILFNILVNKVPFLLKNLKLNALLMTLLIVI